MWQKKQKMVKAYILIESDASDLHKVAKDLSSIDEIETTNMIHGEYDLICKAKADSVIDLKEVVLQKVGKVNGVINTSSLIIADDE